MMHNISRRNFLKTTAAAGLATSLPLRALAKSDMRTPLKIPALLSGENMGDVQVYDLTMQNGVTEFFAGLQTPTSGINGSYLGPTLKMRRDSAVRINVHNTLGESSSLHWHGMHLPAKMDGGPHQTIADGQTWSPEFTIKQKAATLWYHPHLMGKTAEHVWRGMAGMILIEDSESEALDLPDTYGVDDIPLILQDRKFFRNASMEYMLDMHSKMMGMQGDILLANGTYKPHFTATTSKVRLRVLNGSNASTYNLVLDDNKTFTQIATDGGLLEAPVTLKNLVISPGERAEIIVDVAQGENITLYNTAPPSFESMEDGMMGREASNTPTAPFLEIRGGEQLSTSTPLPKTMTTMEWLHANDAVKTRGFDLEMQMGMRAMMGLGNSHSINGKVMDMNRIDEVVQLGDTEIWEVRNTSMRPHPFHMHDVQFQILDRNGMPPPANEKGRKDVVLVNPGEVVRIIMRFEDYADENAPFMYHCHILEHEDAGMMGQFVVV